jgi:LDH2 family malate/lactate/ureidoglycolate dehydrogenase
MRSFETSSQTGSVVPDSVGDPAAARFSATALRAFAAAVLQAAGARADDAAITADVLVAADSHGVTSHGLARLETFYVTPLRAGAVRGDAPLVTITESPSTIVLDANDGLGHPASVKAMRHALDKARTCGIAAAAVRESNHHGMTSYYAMMALEDGMIGIAASNTPRLMSPTFGREILLGNSPLAVAIPALGSDAFVLDMAMSAVALGKIEVAARTGQRLEHGWALDHFGRETLDPKLAESLEPLGGAGGGGHKGYALSLLVELLVLLAGGVFGRDVPAIADMFEKSGRTSHFFLALDIARFRPLLEFRSDVGSVLRELRESAPADGALRVFTPGEIGAEAAAFHAVHGVGLDAAVVASLERLAAQAGIALPQPV